MKMRPKDFSLESEVCDEKHNTAWATFDSAFSSQTKKSFQANKRGFYDVCCSKQFASSGQIYRYSLRNVRLSEKRVFRKLQTVSNFKFIS